MSKHAEELLLDALREILAKQRTNLREDLREELQAELRKELRETQPALPTAPAALAPVVEPEPIQKPIQTKTKKKTDTAVEHLVGEIEEGELEPITLVEQEALSKFQARAREPFAPTNLPRLITSFVFVMIIGLAIVNVPLPMTNGLPLARAMPDRASLIIRDGIVLKASGPEIYMIENNQKRWISSIGAFERHFQWRDVHFVDDEFLTRFADGRPIHLVVKCDSPHIYRIEENKKRWIKDIPTFLNEGHYWGEVTYKSCTEMRTIPDGIPIPPDAGTPPKP